MVVCRFFLEGRCKFGENCRNEHQYSSGRNNQQVQHNYNRPTYFPDLHSQQQQVSNNRTYFPNSPAPQQVQSYFPANQARYYPQTKNVESVNTIKTHLNTVVEDAIAWEKGGQWLFSCYAPLLRRLVTLQQCNETCLPGLIDFSPEEIRWETYKCFQVSGSLDHMLTQLARLAELYSIKRRALQNMDNATVDFIVRYESGERPNSSGTVFESVPMLKSIELAGGSSGSFQFVSPTAAASVTTAPPSSFRFVSPSAAATVATGPPSNFRFVSPAASSSLASGPSSSFSFVSPTASASGNSQPSANVFPTSSQLQTFVRPTPATAGLSVTKSVDDRLYTCHDQLSAEDLAQYNSAKFCFRQVPLKPPSRELCL